MIYVLVEVDGNIRSVAECRNNSKNKLRNTNRIVKY